MAGHFDEVMIVNPVSQQGGTQMRFYPIARTIEGWGEPVGMLSQPITARAQTAVITRVLKARFGSRFFADVKRAVGRWTVFRSDRGRRVALHVEMNKTTLDGLVSQMQAAGITEGTCIELCATFGYLGQVGDRRVNAVKFTAWRKEGDGQWRGGECASPKWVARRCRGQAATAPPPAPPPPTPPPPPLVAGYFAEAPDQMGYYGEMPDTIGYVYEAPEMNGYGGYGVGYVADPPPGFVEGYGYYAETPEMGYVYEAPEAVGYYAEAPEFAGVGYVYEAPDSMGYYAEGPEMGYYAKAPDQMGYYAEAPEMGYYAEAPDQMGYYAESPDMMGYDEAPEMGYYDEAPIEGYVRERDAGARVVPLENINGVEGYYRPRSINPTCENIRPAEEEPRAGSVWFQPLW